MAIVKAESSGTAVGTARMTRRTDTASEFVPPKPFDMAAEERRNAKRRAAEFTRYQDKDGKVFWSFTFTMPDDLNPLGTARMRTRGDNGQAIPPRHRTAEKWRKMDPDFKGAAAWGTAHAKEIGAKSVTVAIEAREPMLTKLRSK